jgi:hypothetical protein
MLSGSLTIGINPIGGSPYTGKTNTYDYQGNYTCPNNKIALVKNFYISSTDNAGVASPANWVCFVSDKRGNRRSAHTLGFTSNKNINDINIVLYAGDTVYVGISFAGSASNFDYDATVLQYDL